MESNLRKLSFIRFESLWKSVSHTFDASKCRSAFDGLNALYCGDDRHYHSDQHILQCLDQMDQANTEIKHQPSVELAIWFHDSIYKASDPDNEKNSAAYFSDLASSDLPTDLIAEVCDLIICTEHKVLPETANEKMTIDVDLSSFGMPSEKFISDGRLIRKEFDHMSDSKFIQGQIKFLQKLIERSAIYSTAYFNDKYEIKARKNIDYLLEQYSEGHLP